MEDCGDQACGDREMGDGGGNGAFQKALDASEMRKDGDIRTQKDCKLLLCCQDINVDSNCADSILSLNPKFSCVLASSA